MIVASSSARALEVGVVAVVVAGHHAADDVVKVVGPDAVEIPAAERRILHHRGQVPVVFGVDDDRAAMPRPRVTSASSWTMDAGLSVDQRMRGVEPQAVEVILADPVRGVVEDEPAHQRAPSRFTASPHGVRCLLGEIRAAELRQVRAFGAEVVVDDVEDDREAELVRRVDQSAQIVGRAVGARGREQRDAVVAPVARRRRSRRPA